MLPGGGAGPGGAGPGLREDDGGGPAARVVAALTAGAGGAPEWVRLLPRGEVPLGDDREPLWVDEEALAAMVAHFRERGLDLVVDYEHQTLSGHKAPAAGWIRELSAREDGLWARVEWTATARRHIGAREYRYFSPVLRLEEGSRRPLALLHAGLTNTPAINGLTPLVAKNRSGQPTAGTRQWGPGAAADLAVDGQPRENLELLEELAVLLDLPENAGVSTVRGALLALKGNLEHLSRVQGELTALRSQLAEKAVQDEVRAAIKVGKIQPCQRDSALRFARQDLEAFRSFVKNALPQVPMGRLPLEPDCPPEAPASQGLTPQQLLLCESMGIAPEAFKAQEARLRGEKLL
uniref:Mu-like prophage I protein n=1 Tax=Desulfobacca acetoxidans TaxID=60893 RepID=A0A7V4G9X3_9BACT